jgi:hypothetical protein
MPKLPGQQMVWGPAELKKFPASGWIVNGRVEAAKMYSLMREGKSAVAENIFPQRA